MTRDEIWLKKFEELKNWMEVHHHYPPEHTILHNWIRRNIKLRNKGELAEWKCELLSAVESLRTHEHTGGRKKKKGPTPSLPYKEGELFGNIN